MKTYQEETNGFHFFRTLLPGFYTKMPIPRPYVDYMTTELEKGRRKATIVTPNGKIWQVDLFMKHNDLLLGGECWEQFAKANGLQIGQALVFHYRGNFVFSVRLFDAITSCEIRFSSSQKDQVMDENVDVVILDDEDSDQPEEQSVPMDFSTMSKARRSSTIKGHFEIIIREYHLKFSNVLIPAKSRKSSGIEAEDKEVRIRDPNGQIWSIGLFRREGRPDLYMTNKWQGFAKANKLKPGDRCRFHLVEGRQKLYHLKIN